MINMKESSILIPLTWECRQAQTGSRSSPIMGHQSQLCTRKIQDNNNLHEFPSFSQPLRFNFSVQVDQLLHSHLGYSKSEASLVSVELESWTRNQYCADLSLNISSAAIYPLRGFWWGLGLTTSSPHQEFVFAPPHHRCSAHVTRVSATLHLSERSLAL